MKRCFFNLFKSIVVIFAKSMAPRKRHSDRDARHPSSRKTTKSSSTKSKFRRKLPSTSTMFILAVIFLCTIGLGYMWWKHYLRSRLYTPIVARRMTSRSELGDMGDIRRLVFEWNRFNLKLLGGHMPSLLADAVYLWHEIVDILLQMSYVINKQRLQAG